jgi:RNA polymerase sigma-70 factor, ECF subfamily
VIASNAAIVPQDGHCHVRSAHAVWPIDQLQGKMSSMEEEAPSWLTRIVDLTPGYECEAVGEFSCRLLRLAHTRMPDRLRRRVDPEDIVQSVFLSFFRRHTDGQFDFQSANDVWRLLAAMTYRKLANSIKHHGRQQRDVGRETAADLTDATARISNAEADPQHVAVMFETLEEILNQLPEERREILLLRLEEFSTEEIAAQLEISVRTVNRIISRTRDIAEQILNES